MVVNLQELYPSLALKEVEIQLLLCMSYTSFDT